MKIIYAAVAILCMLVAWLLSDALDKTLASERDLIARLAEIEEHPGWHAIATAERHIWLVTFYRDGLGLALLFEVPPSMAFFDCGGIRLMLTTLQGEAKDHRTSVIYYKVAELAKATEALKARGLKFEREPELAAKMEDHELWIGFLRDPDENLIGIMAEVPFE